VEKGLPCSLVGSVQRRTLLAGSPPSPEEHPPPAGYYPKPAASTTCLPLRHNKPVSYISWSSRQQCDCFRSQAHFDRTESSVSVPQPYFFYLSVVCQSPNLIPTATRVTTENNPFRRVKHPQNSHADNLWLTRGARAGPCLSHRGRGQAPRTRSGTATGRHHRAGNDRMIWRPAGTRPSQGSHCINVGLQLLLSPKP